MMQKQEGLDLMKRLLFSIVLMSILLLVGCGEPTPGELLEKVEEAHKEIESVEVKFKEVSTEQTDVGIIQIDKKNGISYQELDDMEIKLYKDEDGFKFSNEEELMDPTWLEVFELELDNSINMHEDPYGYMKQFDSDLEEKFEIEVKDDEYILTYNGEKEDQQKLVEGLVNTNASFMEEGYGAELDLTDIQADDYELTITIDKETILIKEIDQKIDYSYKIEGEDYDFNDKITYTYTDYNEVEIERPDFADEDEADEDEDEDEEDREGASKEGEDTETIEKEAGEYLDALIQATVFQNAEEYAEKDPSSNSQDVKLEEGETQRDFFRAIYYSNTQANIEGYDVSDDAIENLTEAFMEAISITEYEIVSVDMFAEDDIVATVSVKGIDDQKVYAETHDKMEEIDVKEGFESQDDVAIKNLELLTEAYKNLDDVLDPVEVDVNIMRNEDGSYMVLLQDQYLAGFVQ